MTIYNRRGPVRYNRLPMNRALFVLTLLAGAACADTPGPADPPSTFQEPSAEDKKADPVKLGRRLIEEREQNDNRDKGIRLLHWHANQNPQSAELHLLAAEAISRALEPLDPKKTSDQARHQTLRQLGRPHADAAVKLAPDSGAAHYWRGALLLHEANAEQSLGKTHEAMAEFDKAEALDPKVDDGGPSRMKGKVLAEMPFLLGGSLTKAVAEYRKSLGVAPDRLTTHLWLGEAYLDAKKKDLARQELERVVSAKPRKGHEMEDGADQQEATDKLKQMK